MTTQAAAVAIADNVSSVRERITKACERVGRDPQSVTLIAVSKTWPAGSIVEALRAGVTDFGENRVQEAIGKVAEVAAATTGSSPPPPHWHLIGHLQTNKVRDAVRTFEAIHSVDSERLLRAIAMQASGPTTVMLEVNVSGEATKYGVAVADVPGMVAVARGLEHVSLTGLMTVAPRTPDAEEVRPVFRQLAALAREHGLPQLSMGMTEDFEVAIEEGSTHVRVGRAIFGERQ